MYIIRAAVFWTGTCSLIVAKGVSTKLFLFVLGTDTDVIGGNYKLIPLALVCFTELISKQIWKKS